MDFEIVTIQEYLVAGLTVPLVGREVAARDLDLVNFTWDRYLAREKNVPRVAAYIDKNQASVIAGPTPGAFPYPKLTIKALPVGQKVGDSSILWAETTPATFCYITAPNKQVLDDASKALMDKRVNVNPKNDLSVAANELAKIKPRQYTLNYGRLKDIRAQLGVVKPVPEPSPANNPKPPPAAARK